MSAISRQFDDDPETQKQEAFLQAWANCFGTKATTVSAAMALGLGGENEAARALQDAFLDIGGQNGKVNCRTLGAWISRHRHRRHRGQFIERGKVSRGRVTWLVQGERVDEDLAQNIPPPQTTPTPIPSETRAMLRPDSSVVGVVGVGGSSLAVQGSSLSYDSVFGDYDPNDDPLLR